MQQRQPYLHHAEDILAEMERRKMLVRERRHLRLVWSAPGSCQEKSEGLKNGEK